MILFIGVCISHDKSSRKENAQKNTPVQKTNNTSFFPYKYNYCDKIGYKYAECQKRLSEQVAKKSSQNAQPLNQKSKLMNKLSVFQQQLKITQAQY